MIISGTSPIHIAESLEKGKGLRWCWWCWCWCWCCCWCWCWWWMLKKTKRLTSIMIWRGSCQRCEPDAHRTEPGKSDGRCWGAGFKFFFSLKEYIDVAFPFFLKLKKNLIFRNVFKVRAELRGCTYLEDSSVTIRGVKIYGELSLHRDCLFTFWSQVLDGFQMYLVHLKLSQHLFLSLVGRAFTGIGKHLNGGVFK